MVPFSPPSLQRHDRLGVLQRQPLADEATSIVACHGEAVEAEAAHERQYPARQRALAEDTRRGRCAGAVAGQVRTDERESLLATARPSIPVEVGLREAVQQYRRRPGTLDDMLELDGPHDAPPASAPNASTRSHSSFACSGWCSPGKDASVNRCPSPGCPTPNTPATSCSRYSPGPV